MDSKNRQRISQELVAVARELIGVSKGDEIAYTPRRLTKFLEGGLAVTVYGMGGGYSDTREWSISEDALRDVLDRGKVDVIAKDAIRGLRHTDMGLGRKRRLIIRIES